MLKRVWQACKKADAGAFVEETYLNTMDHKEEQELDYLLHAMSIMVTCYRSYHIDSAVSVIVDLSQFFNVKFNVQDACVIVVGRKLN